MKRIATPWAERVLLLSGDAEEIDLKWFGRAELREIDAFRLKKRRDEWLLSRAAAKQLALELGLATDPRDVVVARPELFVRGKATGLQLSLSHSAGHAAATIGRGPVGVDVQLPRNLAESGAHLFLSTVEEAVMRRCTIANRLIHFWCAKEAAWKQQSARYTTMRQLPLTLTGEGATGLMFDLVETAAIGDVIVGVTIAPPAS